MQVRKRCAAHERYARSGLVTRAQDLQFDVQHGLEPDPNEDPDGDARLAAPNEMEHKCDANSNLVS